jgi:hypothetical protein
MVSIGIELKADLPDCTSRPGLFPKASFMLVWSLFAPAQESILLMRKTGIKGMHIFHVK